MHATFIIMITLLIVSDASDGRSERDSTRTKTVTSRRNSNPAVLAKTNAIGRPEVVKTWP